MISKVLAVGAHPDDIEFGCYGLLRVLLERKCEVSCLVLTDGGLAGRGRWEETREALGGLGIKFLNEGGTEFHDGELMRKLRDCVKQLDGFLDELKPDMVLVHTYQDTHQDHQAACNSVWAACRRRPITILSYPTASTTRKFEPNLVVDIAPFLGDKIAALQLHTSQLSKDYFEASWLGRWHSDRGALLCGLPAVELYRLEQGFLLRSPQ